MGQELLLRPPNFVSVLRVFSVGKPAQSLSLSTARREAAAGRENSHARSFKHKLICDRSQFDDAGLIYSLACRTEDIIPERHEFISTYCHLDLFGNIISVSASWPCMRCSVVKVKFSRRARPSLPFSQSVSVQRSQKFGGSSIYEPTFICPADTDFSQAAALSQTDRRIDTAT